MVNVLVPTKPDDGHSLFVKQALLKKGHQATIWYTADFPQQQTQTFKINNNRLSWAFNGVDCCIDSENKFDVVWFRRPKKPILPSLIHQDDYENASNEINTYFKNIWHIIESDAFWINPIDKLNAVNCKIKQLKVAQEVGLSIPVTIVSNNVEEVKEFIREHNDIIYKTLFPMAWFEDGGKSIRLTYTKNISLEHLPSDKILQAVPGIYQKKIGKAYELRVTYMGNSGIAVKIRSQEHPKGVMDWRYIPGHELVVEPYSLPEDINEKCLALMRRLGIVFGCFDFIVTQEGEYYFLEVNEQGQFLWVEEVNPEIKMLDAFTDFLIHGSSDFIYRESANSVSIEDFTDTVKILKEEALKTHVDTGPFG